MIHWICIMEIIWLNWAKALPYSSWKQLWVLHTSGTFLMSPPCSASVEILTSPPRNAEYMWNWLHVDWRCTSEYDTNLQWRFCRNSLGLGHVCIVVKSCWTFELQCIIQLCVYAGHRSTWKPAKCVSVYVCVLSALYIWLFGSVISHHSGFVSE